MSKSIKYIAKHYDLGNEFFSMWLDNTLTYSSAVYKNDKDDLEKAQKNKFQELINLLNIKEGNNTCGELVSKKRISKKKNGWNQEQECIRREKRCTKSRFVETLEL